MQEKLNTLISSFIDGYFAKKEVQEQLKAEFDRVVGANPVLQVGVKPYILRLNPT